jgi:hypothetical protein
VEHADAVRVTLAEFVKLPNGFITVERVDVLDDIVREICEPETIGVRFARSSEFARLEPICNADT